MDGVQLGFRVPFFVISPYAKENYVSHTVMNHASTLAFVDYNWNLPALNKYVADSGLPLEMLDLIQIYPGGSLSRESVTLGKGSAYPVEPQIPFTSLPYQRQGSYSGDLAVLGASTFIAANSTYTPVYESLPVMAAVGVVLIALLVLAARFTRSRRSAMRSPLAAGMRKTSA